MNNIFEQITKERSKLADQYEQIKLIRSSCDDMLTAVKGSLSAEKSRDSARAAELQRRLNDMSLPNATRRVAEIELEQIQGRKYKSSDEEVAACADEIKCFGELWSDIVQSCQRLSELIREVRHELDTVKSEKNKIEMAAQSSDYTLDRFYRRLDDLKHFDE